MLKNWLKIAVFNYRKNWLTTLINLLGLSVGLTIFLLVFLNWQDEKSYEKWVPNGENIYLVELKVDKDAYNTVINYPILEMAKKTFPNEVEDFAVINYWDDSTSKLNADGHSAFGSTFYVTNSFFDILQMPVVAGSSKDAFNSDNTVALSTDMAKQLFGDDYKNAIGKTVTKDDDGTKYVVNSVYQLPAKNENTVFKGRYAIRVPYLDPNKSMWTNYSYKGYLKLKPGTDIKKLEDQLSKLDDYHERNEGIGQGWYDKSRAPLEVKLTNIRDMKLDAKGSGTMKGDKKGIMILLVLSALILVLSCINFINLNTAQASQRAKEVGVRKALGSPKVGIIGQFLFETVIIYGLAFLISVVLVELLLPSYSKFLDKEIHLRGYWIYVQTILVMLFFALISGIIPAVYLSNFRPIETLKGNFSRSKHGIWLRNGILTLQLIISSFFIICSIIIYAQVNYMMKKDLGFKGDQVYQIKFNKTNYNIENANMKKYELYKGIIKKFPGVVDITGSAQTIGDGVNSMSTTKYDRDSTKSVGGGVGAIDLNFFKFYKIKIVAGRDFNPQLTSDTIKSVIVNEAFAKGMGWNNQEALGKEISSGMDGKKSKHMEIIGVVNDFYLAGVQKEITPVIFFNYQRFWAKNQMTNLQIKLSGDNIADHVEKIKEYWTTKVEPGYAFSGEFVDKNFAKTFEKYEKQRTLFSVLNIIVLIVALSGLFALSSLMIEQKLKIVAIKKTLGASDGSLVRDLTKKYLWMALFAVIISFPISYYAMNEWLKDFAYRIQMPWWPYVLSLLMLLLLTFLVVSIKAFSATKVQLVKYLKYE